MLTFSKNHEKNLTIVTCNSYISKVDNIRHKFRTRQPKTLYFENTHSKISTRIKMKDNQERLQNDCWSASDKTRESL